ncbi:FAD-binding domain-containing protein [Thalassolituus sp. UBA2009]|jgi:deoxyribodipyrimidine photo-lyase|uniref:FAD-binding domain-containing protein n=1 Tax=Thalassolituus sp. UBA2009 TaxID=1947658 RepID=UPI0025810555|nr:FAD-binding domain-containing protein [Thalassolituus sp. UBA2009]
MTSRPINLVWLRNDLRLHDHPVFQHLAAQGECPGMAVVFILPQHWQQPTAEYPGLTRLGLARARFLRACLIDVQRSLYQQNIRLSLLGGDPVSLLRDWYAQQPFHLHTSVAQAPEEEHWLNAIAAFAPVSTYETQTLFSQQHLAELLNTENWPDSYSAFSRWLDKHGLPGAIAAPLPPTMLSADPLEAPLKAAIQWPDHQLHQVPSWAGRVPATTFHGGEDAGLRHLAAYLGRENAIRHYRDTRNQLCTAPLSQTDNPYAGSRFASQLSPWLAWGALSVRKVWADIVRWESLHGASEHSSWLKKELLWREYFHWTLRLKGSALFRNPAPQPFADTRWQAWCEARTGYPVIDAGLRELIHTGYSSNRMRQWLASFFMHELKLDWRLGARFFEQHLIDADVASNWGNWAYIAGCGQDPRGGRCFNLNKQLERYDPHLTHLRQWLPELSSVTLSQVQQHQSGGPALPLWPAATCAAPAALIHS